MINTAGQPQRPVSHSSGGPAVSMSGRAGGSVSGRAVLLPQPHVWRGGGQVGDMNIWPTLFSGFSGFCFAGLPLQWSTRQVKEPSHGSWLQPALAQVSQVCMDSMYLSLCWLSQLLAHFQRERVYMRNEKRICDPFLSTTMLLQHI